MAALPQRPPHNRPPPALPPRSGGQPVRPPPTVTPSIDTDSDPDDYLEPDNNGDGPEEIYDDCSENEDHSAELDFEDLPPSLPPMSASPEEFYDDFEEQPQPQVPKRPPARLPPPPTQQYPAAPQETYDDLDNVGPVVVQQMTRKPDHSRQLPPTPAQLPPTQGIVEDVYEDPDASQPDTMHAGPPPPRNPPPGRTWARIPEPSTLRTASPSRQKSPSRLGDRSLPPIPPISGRSCSPLPVPATRSRQGATEEANSPVVVPLKHRHKGSLPPPPPSVQADSNYMEDNQNDSDSGSDDNQMEESFSKLESNSDEEDKEEKRDCQNDSDSDFPPPPPPLSNRRVMLAPHKHNHPPPYIPSNLPSHSHNDQGDAFYEVGNDEPALSPPPAPPPPPPPPPKEQKRPEARLPAQPRPAPSQAPKPAGSGSFSIDLNQLKGMRAGLRKVSAGGVQESNSSSADPKIYGECAPSVADVKKKFMERADGKPGFLTPKPAIVPKFPKPSPAADQKQPTPPVPDVTFLPKANKDKHTNVPLAQVPAAKPVTKYVPPEQHFEEPDDIYDDASSVDVMDRYDWYHGFLERKQADSKVKSIGKDGTYLVRVSKKDPHFPFTLVVLHKGHVNNLRIRKRADNKFALGDEKQDELTFTDVMALINHHNKNNVVLLGNSQTQVKLLQTPPKG